MAAYAWHSFKKRSSGNITADEKMFEVGVDKLFVECGERWAEVGPVDVGE